MKSDVGLVWTATWNRFELMVLKAPDGFRSVILGPWDEDAKMCNSVRHTLEEAQCRCWGMVREDCELRAAQAAMRMMKTNASSVISNILAECGDPMAEVAEDLAGRMRRWNGVDCAKEDKRTTNATAECGAPKTEWCFDCSGTGKRYHGPDDDCYTTCEACDGTGLIA